MIFWNLKNSASQTRHQLPVPLRRTGQLVAAVKLYSDLILPVIESSSVMRGLPAMGRKGVWWKGCIVVKK
uniref:Uncharacterized protein n=1 Tax=Rhizoctonia solani TaxID=456999 RepID=N0A563_9AGAM|nr:hypothetical protein RSOL_m00510 [Rhizoctonia solani]AGK45385.1 hypothetical protein RSOL_m00510 [Rhizoctonia solani]